MLDCELLFKLLSLFAEPLYSDELQFDWEAKEEESDSDDKTSEDDDCEPPGLAKDLFCLILRG